LLVYCLRVQECMPSLQLTSGADLFFMNSLARQQLLMSRHAADLCNQSFLVCPSTKELLFGAKEQPCEKLKNKASPLQFRKKHKITS